LEGLGFHLGGDFGISVGRFQTDVPKPCADNVHFNTGFEQMDGRCVSKRMWGQPITIEARMGYKTTNDFVDPKSGQCASGAGREYGGIRHPNSAPEPIDEHVGGVLPQRARAPFVALAMQMSAGLVSKIQIANSQFRSFLYAGAGVIEEEQQGLVSQ
jgi:hypothetical protein